MKALILNSGLGSRMGVLTSEHPKCMTEISPRETILSRQLRQIAEAGIRDVVITTGYYDEVLVNYCRSLDLPLEFNLLGFSRHAEETAMGWCSYPCEEFWHIAAETGCKAIIGFDAHHPEHLERIDLVDGAHAFLEGLGIRVLPWLDGLGPL